MKKRMFVIKNTKTNKYWTGYSDGNSCTGTDLSKAEFYDEDWVLIEYRALGGTLRKNERFVEIEIKEKKVKK